MSGYVRVQENEAGAGADPVTPPLANKQPLTPPTVSGRPPPPPPIRLNQVNAAMRTSVYIDALEQLMDEEVLADSCIRTVGHKSSRRVRRKSSVGASQRPPPTSASSKGIHLALNVRDAVRAFGRLSNGASGAAAAPPPDVQRRRSRESTYMRSTAAPSMADAAAEAPAPQQLRRKFTIFSSADGEDGLTSDHTRQRTALLRIAAFFLHSMYIREFLFLVLLGVLSALLALGSG